MNDDQYEQNHDPKCPFCDSSDACAHLLLVVDKTFRVPEGGILMDAFASRWSALFEENEDFDESEEFANLLEEVFVLADSMTESEFQGGPGMSFAYDVYYSSTSEGAIEALRIFTKTPPDTA